MFSKVLNLLFPSKCPVCGNKSDSSLYNPLCTACWGVIERYSGPACGICGIPTTSHYTTICESCLKTRPPFSKILYYGIYDGALKESIHLLKFKGIKRLSKPLGLRLSELPVPEADGIIPVPLHQNSLRQREFNQTSAISRHLSKELNILLMPDVLKKDRETPPQTYVDGKGRLKNVKGVFSVSGDIKGLDLLLVDDVITTGATVRECARVLVKAGAKKVTVLALARSMPKQNT
ncbi:MAG: ComF family protein [Nitrospirae bacterium]|nr:ComF family protein [Nitrospirota bacterium]